jgi:hypothetical protein
MVTSVDAKSVLPAPPGWASDTLSEFIELAHRNRFATFANKKAGYRRLARIDLAFVQAGKDWLNPKGLVPPFLLFRSHAAFRGACEHALAGQVAELFPQVRASIEYAAYALHIHKNPGLEEVWLRRHDDEKSLKTVKSQFHGDKVSETIVKANRAIGSVFKQLYQRAIDFGAHPNERSVTSNASIKQHVGRKELQQIYLHGDGLQLDHALKTTAQAGVCALEIFNEVFGPRFELLGIRAELLVLRRGL